MIRWKDVWISKWTVLKDNMAKDNMEGLDLLDLSLVAPDGA